MNNNDNQFGMTLSDIFSDRYVVPLYQRNFAWRTDEIQQLLQDISDAFQKNATGNYYIGSLVIMKRHNGDYEVIDGQQRLTVISLIAILMGKLTRPVLFYDSRPEVQEFFDLLCRNSDAPDAAYKLNAPSLFYLKEACDFIKNATVEKTEKRDGQFSYSKVAFLGCRDLADYFLKHVVLVRNEIPEDTDVAAYFEIMNNRGAQLQKHEIIKAKMMANIGSKEQRGEFAKIWDACSQMDTPIQRLFSSVDRKKYFGETYDGFTFVDREKDFGKTYDGFTFPVIVELGEPQNDKAVQWSLEDILLDKAEQIGPVRHDETDTMETDVYSYNSVIDFPNFLMHVLRLYLDTAPQNGNGVPLNEKELLNEYGKNQEKINPVKFVKLLLFCRTAFDRFVVKTAADAEDPEDGRKWVLLKPKSYGTSWKFTSSFEDEVSQRKVVKALSMLQVTFRTRIYKTWLYDVLKWLYAKYQQEKILSFGADAYLDFLHRWMLDYYTAQHFDIRKLPDGELPSSNNSCSLGTGTPHFLLNFIDYLYWCRESGKYADFEFKYWNSVEHHLAQNKATGEAEQYVDCLGNLYLISRSANSRLSDRVVQEKVDFYQGKNMGPNRQIIYEMTKSNGYRWEGKQIAEHYNDIVDLLCHRYEILGLENKESKDERF